MKPVIDMVPVDSSQLCEIGYCSTTNTLAIRFRSKGQPGKLYQYPKVPPDLFHEFKGSESLGTFFGQRIKNAKDDEGNPLYPHQLIVEEPDESAEPQAAQP